MDVPVARVPEPEPVARRFGDYELLEVVAQGGMGVVYRARQLSLGRIVALKMIRAGVLASELDITRFRAEARAAAGLHHPHIIAIHEVGEHDDRHYFSMEFVAGRNLAQAVREHPWSADRAARCLLSVARAVDHAHRQGIVHRDLKPSNIIIDPEDEPHLTDFGLATQIEGTSTLTLSGMILGTPCYMAPEQTGGRRSEIGPRTDVYALGAILYEVVTGRPPFLGETPLDTMKMVRETEVVALRRLNPRLPSDLETICLKCLEKEVGRRYASAGELAEDLERFLRREPIRARPAGRWDQALKWVRRNPWRAALAGVTGIMMLAGFGLAFAVEKNRILGGHIEELVGLNRALAEEKALVERTQVLLRSALATEQAARAGEAEQRHLAEAARDEARLLDYLNRISMAHRAWKGNDLLLAENLLSGCAEEHRHWEWHYLWALCRPDLGVIDRFAGLTNRLVQAKFSPDRRRVATIDELGNVQRLSLGEGAAVSYPDLRDRTATSLAFATEHPWLAVGCSHPSDTDTVTIVDSETTNRVLRFPVPGTAPRAMAFADRDRLLLTVDSGGLSAWDTVDGTRRWEAVPPSGHEMFEVGATAHQPWVIWTSGPGRRVASGQGEDESRTSVIHVGDLASGREHLSIPFDGPSIRSVLLGSDGSDSGVIYTGHADGEFRLWSRKTGAPLRTLRHGFGTLLSVAEASDGYAFVCSSTDGTLGFKRLSHREDPPLELLRGHRGAVLAVALENESSSALSVGADGTVRRWNLRGPQDGLRVAAKGETLAFLDEDRILLPGGAVVHSNGVVSGSVATDTTGTWRLSVATNTCWVSWGQSVSPWPPPGTTPTSWSHVRRYPHSYASAFSHDGSHLAFGGRFAGPGTVSVEVFAVPSWSEVARVPVESVGRSAFDMAFTPDDSLLAVAAGAHGGAVPGSIELWDWRASRRVRTFPTLRFCPWTVAVGSDGRRIASGGGYLLPTSRSAPQPSRPYGEVLVWDLETGELLFSLPGVSESAITVRFSPDGQRLAAAVGAYSAGRADSGPPGEVPLWEMRRGLPVLTLEGFPGPVTGVAFSPSGRRIAAIGSGVVRIFEAPSYRGAAPPSSGIK